LQQSQMGIMAALHMVFTSAPAEFSVKGRPVITDYPKMMITSAYFGLAFLLI